MRSTVRRNVGIVAGAALAGMLLAGCGGGDHDSENDEPSVSDAESCAPEEGDTGADAIQFDLDDDSLTIRLTDPDSIEGQLMALVTISCVVNELDGPSSLADRVGATNGFAGPQSEEWGNFEANWSYSGTSGLLFTVDES